jgi:hypothetical protein
VTVLRLVAILSAGLLLSGQASAKDDLDSAFTKDRLVVSADEHACYLLDVYVASTDEQRKRGLMHVRELPDFTGMIFVYRQPRIYSMWMKNTYIPLDMVFIRGDGTVSSVSPGADPLTLDSVSAIEPVNYVLELNAGIAARLGIGNKSRIVFTNQE